MARTPAAVKAKQKATAKRKSGPPSKCTSELIQSLCDRLMQGRSLRSICQDDDTPNIATVCTWLSNNTLGIHEHYARARDIQADVLAAETQDIADDARNDWMERHGKDDQGWLLNGESVQRSRLRIDQRKWYASKLAPKKYGEKVEVTGAGGGAIQFEQIQRVIVDPKS